MASKVPSYKKLKEHDIRKGRYPIKVSLSIWDDGKSEPFVDLYSGVPTNSGYKHNHFKITNKKVWYKIKKIIDDDLIKNISKGKQLSEKALEKEINNDIEMLKQDNLKMGKTIKAYSKIIKEYRTIKIPEYKEDVKELESLMKKAKKEKELQKFLSKKTWLLGLEYESSTPEKIGVGQRYDFYVEKYDGYADIIEIKKVNELIFDKKGKVTTVFSKAIQQLIDYIDDAILWGNNKRLAKKLNFNFLKPKGILIIGKNQDVERLKNLQYYFHNIEILTYDDVLDRGKNIIKHLDIKKKKRK